MGSSKGSGEARIGRQIDIPFEELQADESQFQGRDLRADGPKVFKAHKGSEQREIDHLVESLNENPEAGLDRIKVWKSPDDGKWYVVDGFHRFKAYQRARQERASGRPGKVWNPKRNIPCRVVEGSREAVRIAVFQQNRKPQMGYTQRQRIEHAWLALWRDDVENLSGREAARALHVSRAVVDRMRATIRDKYSDHWGPEPPCRWREVGTEEEPEPDENERDRMKQEMTKSLVEGLSVTQDDDGLRMEALREALEAVASDLEVTEREDAENVSDY